MSRDFTAEEWHDRWRQEKDKNIALRAEVLNLERQLAHARSMCARPLGVCVRPSDWSEDV